MPIAVRSICGAVLISKNPDELAKFYGKGLGLNLTREEHSDLAPHWGVDIGQVHFGIHPPENFNGMASGRAGIVLAFDVTSLSECRQRLEALGARCLQPPHDEGFGLVASFTDPEGNTFEVVELNYSFASGGGA